MPDIVDTAGGRDETRRGTERVTGDGLASNVDKQQRNTNTEEEEQERGRSRLSRRSSESNLSYADHNAHEAQVPPSRSVSRAQSSLRSPRRDAIPVDCSQRRGLFARLAILLEVTEPYDYARSRKWIITAVVAVAASVAPMGSAIILPALSDIQEAFRAPPVIVNLSIALYMLSMSFFPLWWSYFSEMIGRRSIYIVSFTLFLVFNILAAVSVNITMFIVTRCLAGAASASVQAIGSGTIADIWEVKERGKAMGYFYLGPLCGPLVAPIISGVLTLKLGWRSTQWFMVILGACILLLIAVCLPETLRSSISAAKQAEMAKAAEAATAEQEKEVATAMRPSISRTSTRKTVHVKTRKFAVMLRRAFIDPLGIISYLQFPAVALSISYASIVFASLYVLNIAIEATFSAPPYNYSSEIVGLLYIPNSMGYFISSLYAGSLSDRIMHREARKAGRYNERGRLVFLPEDRMRENAWFGAILFPLSLIVFGWTSRYAVNIAVPMIANFCFGLGSMVVFGLVTTSLTEYMPRKASAGVALNNFVRNILSCVATIVAQPAIVAIGDGWLFTILGLICLISGIFTILAMKQFGPRWRLGMAEKMERMMGD